MSLSWIRAHAKVVTIAVSLLVIVVVLVGSGDNRPLSQVVNEDFGEHALVTGSSVFFNEPATLIFAFTSKWDLFSADKQVLFMKDTGQVWQRKVEGSGADVGEAKVQYEDRFGEIIAIYTPDSGLKIEKKPEPEGEPSLQPETELVTEGSD